MKILFFGDIFGRSGRDALIKEIPYFKKQYGPDFILVIEYDMPFPCEAFSPFTKIRSGPYCFLK